MCRQLTLEQQVGTAWVHLFMAYLQYNVLLYHQCIFSYDFLSSLYSMFLYCKSKNTVSNTCNIQDVCQSSVYVLGKAPSHQ